ncbi:hypothetical protein NFI96_026286 [Prochilodus magdalenae]|nr:hypothetical protein NFI96_026286 [Prochilodus magdalenae]
MKTSWMGLVLGLVLLMAVSSDAGPFISPDPCCFNFVTFKIPEMEIIQVVETHPDCAKQGYVYITKRGKLCKEEIDVD